MMNLTQVAVLFARADSVYKTLPGCDVYDIERDARNWPGGCPVVAHPPCRAWGRLRHFAKPRVDEKALAIFAVEQVRRWGGVLEHPQGSALWRYCNLPAPGKHGERGFTLGIHQHWFGHRAAKATLLYIVGCDPMDVPRMRLRLDEPTHVVQSTKRQDYRPHITKAEREHTPPALAEWLVELARRCRVDPAYESLQRERLAQQSFERCYFCDEGDRARDAAQREGRGD